MKLKGKAKQVAQNILDAFQRGDVPKALAQVFIHRTMDCPAASWSWRNRLITALQGHYDARGFRQWLSVGRTVKRGSRAFYILGPCTVKAKKDDDARGIEAGDPILIGFRAIPVFGYAQTEGDPLSDAEALEDDVFIDALPLIEVARSWNLTVSTFNGAHAPRLGAYKPGKAIALGVENLSTWAHELIHAADDRRGTLTRKPGQQLDNETVAEFGATILLECLGYTTDSDRGGAYNYIQRYANEHNRSPINVCTDLIERTCACVALILETAEQIQASEPVASDESTGLAQAANQDPKSASGQLFLTGLAPSEHCLL